MNMLKNKKILAAIAGALVTVVGGVILLVKKGQNGRTVSPAEVEEIMKDIPQVDDLGEESVEQ